MVRSSSTPRGCTLAEERGPGTEGNHRKRYECAFDFIRHRGSRHSGPLVVHPPRCAPARSDEVPPQRRPVSAAVCGDSEGPYPHLALRPTYTHTYTHTPQKWISPVPGRAAVWREDSIIPVFAFDCVEELDWQWVLYKGETWTETRYMALGLWGCIVGRNNNMYV